MEKSKLAVSAFRKSIVVICLPIIWFLPIYAYDFGIIRDVPDSIRNLLVILMFTSPIMFIVDLVIACIGLVISIKSLIEIEKAGLAGKGIAIAALIICSILIFLCASAVFYISKSLGRVA